MKEFIHSRCKKKKKKKNSRIIFYQWKELLNSNDSFSRIKIYPLNFNYGKFEKTFEKAIVGVKISYCKCSKWNNKVSFQHLKQNLISNNTSNNTNSANLSSTNLVNVINANHELNAPNIPNLNY